MRTWLADEQGVALTGDLPDSVEVYAGSQPPPDVEFLVPSFLRPADPGVVASLAELKVVQLLTAGADAWIGRVPDGVTLCDARGVHSSATAEWTLTAILSYLRAFPGFIRAQAAGEWAYRRTDELAGKRVLIVGAGAIGEAIADRLAPFEVELVRVARVPRPGVYGVADLPSLLPEADVVILIVPLTPATINLVDATFLAAMKDGALLVNAARGRVVQTDALTAELITGRIGAAVDVTEPEPLPAGHPLWQLPNFLLTPHVAASVGGTFRRAYGLAGDQIRRYVAGQPLINVVTGDY